LDANRPPVGERQRQAILAEIVAGGDTAEKHYLEVKRELDFSSKEETTKVAKFILGAANRLPALAERNFAGYAVMVIGAEKGGLPGVPEGTEMLHIEQKISKFLHPGGPTWELDREPANEPGREVLFILVDPPQEGDPVYPCRANFQGSKANLADGDIYVRPQGATRKATAPEVDALVARAGRSSTATPELTVKLDGDGYYLDESPESLDKYVANMIDAARRKHVESPTVTKTFTPIPTAADRTMQALGLGSPASWTLEEFDTAAKEWEQETRSSWRENLEQMAGAALPGLTLELGNLQSSFLEAVRLDLTLENAYGVQFLDPEDVNLRKLFPPVIRKSDPFGYAQAGSLLNIGNYRPAISHNPHLTWANDGQNLRITVELEHLRPRTPWISDRDDLIDLVVIGREKDATSISGFWRATVRGHHEAFEGTVTLPMGNPQGIQSLVRLLNPEDAGGNGD